MVMVMIVTLVALWLVAVGPMVVLPAVEDDPGHRDPGTNGAQPGERPRSLVPLAKVHPPEAA